MEEGLGGDEVKPGKAWAGKSELSLSVCTEFRHVYSMFKGPKAKCVSA